MTEKICNSCKHFMGCLGCEYGKDVEEEDYCDLWEGDNNETT